MHDLKRNVASSLSSSLDAVLSGRRTIFISLCFKGVRFALILLPAKGYYFVPQYNKHPSPLRYSPARKGTILAPLHCPTYRGGSFGPLPPSCKHWIKPKLRSVSRAFRHRGSRQEPFGIARAIALARTNLFGQCCRRR